jgi:hypothetical protein
MSWKEPKRPLTRRIWGNPVAAYDEAKPYGAGHVRHAHLAAGDTLALIVQSRKCDAPAVPG